MKKLRDLISYAKKFGGVTIVYAPNLDSVLSTSILMKIFREYDIDAEAAPFYEARKPLDCNTLLVLVGVKQHTAIPGVKCTIIDDYIGRDPHSSLSIALHIIAQLREIWIVPKDLDVLATCAMLSIARKSLYDDMLIEAHKHLLTDIFNKGVIDYVDSIRFFGYPHIPLEEAITRTIDPYIPGISLNPDAVRDFLRGLGVADTLSDEAKKRILDEVRSRLEAVSKESIDIVGKKLLLRHTELHNDLYELTYALITSIDVLSSEQLLILSIEPKYVDVFLAVYMKILPEVRNIVEAILSGEVSVKRSAIRMHRLSTIEIDGRIRAPYLIHRLLRVLGAVESITVFRSNEGYCIPIQLADAKWPLDHQYDVGGGCIYVKSFSDIPKVLGL